MDAPPKDAYLTGIYKRPVGGPVRITPRGLARRPHRQPSLTMAAPTRLSTSTPSRTTAGGNPPSAVRSSPGVFGENLTLSELDHVPLAIGDRLRIGRVLLEITAPRIPVPRFPAAWKTRLFKKIPRRRTTRPLLSRHRGGGNSDRRTRPLRALRGRKTERSGNLLDRIRPTRRRGHPPSPPAAPLAIRIRVRPKKTGSPRSQRKPPG